MDETDDQHLGKAQEEKMRGATPKKIADDDNVDGNEQQDDRRESI